MAHEDENQDGRPSPGVKAVDTSVRIVEAIKELDGGRVTDIVNRTGLSKGAVYKHLCTLRDHDFVVKNGTEYDLGFRFLDYGGWLRSRYPGSELIEQQVRELAEQTNEVALFGVRENDRVVTLFRETGSQGVFTRTRLGRRLHLNQTAAGKTLLAYLPEAEVEEIIDTVGLPQATENTITDEAALFEELNRIRERGYAFNWEESTEGLVGIAVPLIPQDTILGACSVGGPRHRMDKDRLENEIRDLLLSVANELELNIAHSQQATDIAEYS